MQVTPAAGEPYQVGGNVTRPEKISGVPPVYNEEARKARVTGIVIVEAIIDEQGNVTNAAVLKGLPMGLDRSALNAIQTWKFKPATLDGIPVRVYYTLTVNFQIEDGPFVSPLFLRFLERNPDFAGHLTSQRYQEAAELLDRWGAERPADSEISLARTHLLLRQGRLDEAWEEARSYRGPEPFEVLYAVGSYARQRAIHDMVMTPERRTEVIELGLQALTMALAAKRDFVGALFEKSSLLREKAKLTPDPEERQLVVDEADELQREALEIQARAREAKSGRGSAGGESLRVGGDVKRPEKLSGNLPVYTELGRKAGVSGAVIIEAVIDEQGDVAEATVVKGLPMGLDKAALDAIEGWKFKPATREGKPVQVLYTVTVRFTPPSGVDVEME
jgi:TonB family protein